MRLNTDAHEWLPEPLKIPGAWNNYLRSYFLLFWMGCHNIDSLPFQIPLADSLDNLPVSIYNDEYLNRRDSSVVEALIGANRNVNGNGLVNDKPYL